MLEVQNLCWEKLKYCFQALEVREVLIFLVAVNWNVKRPRGTSWFGVFLWEVIKLSNLTSLLSKLVSSLFLKQQFYAAIKVDFTNDSGLKMPVLKSNYLFC